MRLITKSNPGLSRYLTLAGGVGFSAVPAWAQCAMCKAAAGSQKAAAILALNQGIILLAIPPAAILIGIAWLTYKHWDAPGDPEVGADPQKPL